jgi:outer membrane protein
VLLLAGSAKSETLVEAMTRAYRSNPSFHAERYKLRATDEEVARALSGWRPRVAANGFYGWRNQRHEADPSRTGSSDTYGYGLAIEQPLFDGFQTKHAVSQAESNVAAGRAELSAFENELLFQVAAVYLDVLREEGIVLFRRKSLAALKREVIGVTEQLARGQATATDLDQARLRASRAQSDLDQSTANLRVSELRYTRLTGRTPADLVMPVFPQARLPQTLDDAAARAERENPIIEAATLKHAAATHAVSRTRGELLPIASIVGSYDRSVNDSSTTLDRDGFSVVGRLRVPLYQRGEVSARVRQTHNIALQVEREGLDARSRIGEAVRAAWATLLSARARTKADEDAVEAGEKALEGIRTEQRHGRRSVIAVLDADRELVEARIRLLRTTRDLFVSAYALIRSTGRLTVAELAPGSSTYDPETHYRQVRNMWWGTSTPSTGDDALLGNGEKPTAKAAQRAGRWNTTINRAGAR